MIVPMMMAAQKLPFMPVLMMTGDVMMTVAMLTTSGDTAWLHGRGRAKTQEFRKRLAKGETFDDILEEAFAVVREAAWRVLELRHYDVQVSAVIDKYAQPFRISRKRT